MKKKIILALLAGMLFTALPVHAELNTEETQKLDAYYTLASNYITTGDYEKAKEYVNACFDYCDDESVSDELLADLYLKKGCLETIDGEQEAAIQDLDKAISYRADLSDAYLVKIQIYLDLKEYEPAIDSIKTYIELTGEQEMNGTLAEIYELMGDTEKAADTYDAYIQTMEVSEKEAAFQNALYQMGIGLYDKAIENFEACMEEEEYAQPAAYNRLICLMDLGNYEEAEAGFLQGMEAGWDYDGIYYNLAVCKMMTEDYDGAMENFRKSQETENYKDESSRSIALCMMSTGNVDGAIEELTGLIERESILADEARYYRTSCYTEKEEYELALADITACIENGYRMAQSYYERAQIHQLMGEDELYIADLEASVTTEN